MAKINWSWLVLLLCVVCLSGTIYYWDIPDIPAVTAPPSAVPALAAPPVTPVTPRVTPMSRITSPPVPTPTPILWPPLVNADYPLSPDYIPAELTAPDGSYLLLCPEAAEAFDAWMQAARADGIRHLHLLSAYRTYEEQQALYDARVDLLRGAYGQAAYAMAARTVARPGQSEHQLGLALDVSTGYSLIQSFGETEAGLWLARTAPAYGFVLRYPADKESITGVMYEPWHFRYVGVEHAQAMDSAGLCLEEYIQSFSDQSEEEEDPSFYR